MNRPKLMKYAIIVRLLTMTIVWLVLLTWFFNAYRTDCGTTLAIFLLLCVLLLVPGIERSFLLRRALFKEYLSGDERLFDLFQNRFLMILRETAYALILATFLLVGALVLEPRQWSLLFIVLLLLTLLTPRLANTMSGQVREEYRHAISRQRAIGISVFLLWGEAVMVLTISPPEDYMGMRWQEVVTYGVSEPDVLCPLVSELANVYVVGQAIAIWAVQNASRVSNDPTQAIMVWVGYFTLISFPFMVALAFSRALVGVLGRPWEMLRKHGGPGAAPMQPISSAPSESD
ncbi:MAG: hypothetical protein WBG92_06815 [Thiohalocapsa sp.]